MDTLGGYRLLRKLGEGPRAEVFLGRAQGEGSAGPVAIKVFRAGVTEASIAAEVEALSRGAGPHVVGLADITTAPDGAQTLLLERQSGSTLARLLRDRSDLLPGEAITILAPLAAACARLHRAGVVHGAVRPDAVLFDGAGAPVLACFGRSFLIRPGQPPAMLDAVPGVAFDIAAFATLANRVLGAVHQPSVSALSDWIESSPAREKAVWLSELEERLFDLADPAAVDFTPDLAGPVERLPQRSPVSSPVGEPEPSRSRLSAALALPQWVEQLIPAQLGAVPERIRGSLSAVRARVWVAAAAVGVALVAALVLVPQGASDAESVGLEPAPTPSSDLGSTARPLAPSSGTEAGGAAVAGDDPVAALIALVEARQRCISDMSVLCLDDVAQLGSAALAADQELVRQLQDGAEFGAVWHIDPDKVTITERLGDSAILDLGDVATGEPASVLLMKSEAGWRIRDYLEG